MIFEKNIRNKSCRQSEVTQILYLPFFSKINPLITTCPNRCENWVFPIFSKLSHPSEMTYKIKVVDNNKTHILQEEKFEPTDYQVRKQV